MNVRPIAKPPGLAIGSLSVGVAEQDGHFYAEVPPLGRLSGSSLEGLAAAVSDALQAFQERGRALEANELERALEVAHKHRRESLARLAQQATLETAREHRVAALRYAVLVLLFMPLLKQSAPAWRLGR
ncbi:TPA: hypothetical protein ACKP7M_003171 [Stenotrophomonas maltophilia]|nr:hypothetical protein [Stenotrophomonas maltophilia]MBH1531790.1 hypothetical protein [Stenotrophomonas maltophilia]HDS1196352.1 hypothetical protein [Stenotrophomonas maltophilia]